jgi:hypothetical protein
MPFSGTSTVVDPDQPPSMIPVPAKSPAPVDTEIFWLTPGQNQTQYTKILRYLINLHKPNWKDQILFWRPFGTTLESMLEA